MTFVLLFRKERSSVANATAKNLKRRLSAIEPIQTRKMRHRMDTIFTGGNRELGCIEIGPRLDQTKEFYDSRLKMPLVLRDMLLDIIKAPKLLYKTQTLGYSISGGKISMMCMDVPGGMVTRIRRSEPIEYPSSATNFVPRLLPLLELNLMGFMIMSETLNITNATRMPLQQAGVVPLILLPTYVPATPTKSTSSSSESSSSTSTSKKQK